MQVLCPYGEWKHSNGMQYVDRIAAEKMYKNFHSIKNFLRRKIPIYIGHPDDSPHKRQKPKAVGQVREIHLLDGGIAILSEYNEHILKKFRTCPNLALSPRWQMEKLNNGKFRPVKLISVGVTEYPNISESGRIIKIQTNTFSEPEKLKRKIFDTVNACNKILKQTQVCLRKATSNNKKINTHIVSERIKKLTKPSPKEKPNLTELAKERSKKLGEPYTKSFATVRKIHNQK